MSRGTPAAPMATPSAQSTRERIIVAAMQLFAERGLNATRIGDIEDRAGLTRRGGGFYRHFASKHAVLEAGVERHIAMSAEHRRMIDLLPLADVSSELTLVCKWLLEWLDGHRVLLHVIEKEGSALPRLRDRVREATVQPAYREAVALVARWSGRPGDDPRLATTVAILMGAVENYRRAAWTFGASPLNIDDDTFVRAWVHTSRALLGSTVGASASTSRRS